MKSLQVIFYGDPHGYPPIINGARFLAGAGWEVEIVCRDEETHAPIRWPDGVRIVRIARGARRGWREYLRFVREARRLARPGGIVAGHDMHGLLPAALMARNAGAPLVYHCHDFTESSRSLPLGSRIVKLLEPRLARRARLVIVPDERRAAIVREALGLPYDPLVVPNAPMRSPRPARGRLRNALATAGRPLERIVLRQGRVGPGHGIEATIASMPRWADSRAGLAVMGPCEDVFAAKLRAQARECGVERRFAILPPVGYDDVASFTIDADIGHALYDPVNVNHVEMGTASNKMMEYMAAGIPSIVPDGESFRRLLGRCRCAIAVDAASAEAIAKAIDRLLGDPAFARELGEAGRRVFETELHYERQAGPMRERLEALAPPL